MGVERLKETDVPLLNPRPREPRGKNNSDSLLCSQRVGFPLGSLTSERLAASRQQPSAFLSGVRMRATQILTSGPHLVWYIPQSDVYE